MINCPKCNEPIGEDLKVCPICRYEFSEKDMADIRKELADKENKLFYYRKEIRENAAKKRTRYVCIMLLSLFVPVILGCILTKITKNYGFISFLAPVGIISELVVMIVAMINGAFRCPFCDGILYRNHGRYCQNCGEKL
jgi:predicted amidophosphoribosyltransferase